MLLDVVVSGTEWMNQAECRSSDPEIFFDNPAQAKAVCAPCPVMAQCRQFGQGEAFGVFGGLDASERENERHGRREARQDRDEEARRLYLAGESFASIAERLGLTVSNAKWIINNGADSGAVAREAKAKRKELAEANAEKVRQLHAEGLTAYAIIKATGLSNATVYRVVREATAA